jgi:hypothetical protein
MNVLIVKSIWNGTAEGSEHPVLIPQAYQLECPTLEQAAAVLATWTAAGMRHLIDHPKCTVEFGSVDKKTRGKFTHIAWVKGGPAPGPVAA